MDAIQLLLLVIAMTPSACSECTPLDEEFFYIYKGEAFYFVPLDLEDANQTNDEITWYKNSSPNEPISTNENETVHYHGGALFFLNISTENNGSYTARHIHSPDLCFTYHVNITAFEDESDEALLYGSIHNSDQNKMIPCPDPVSYTCQVFEGELTWMKDFELLHGHSGQTLWVYNANKNDEGIYTCTCYWTHNNKVYKSSASRRLILKDAVAHTDPVIVSVSKELLVDVGSRILLSCSASCGTNAESHCNVTWNVSRQDGYTQISTVNTEPPSNRTISTAVLTIEKVSANDLQTAFKCTVVGFYKNESQTVRLKQRESIVPLVSMGVRVLLLFVSTAVLVKCFAIDLALIFRPYIPFRKHCKDTRIYDAYVIYQMQNLDKTSEDMLSQFVTKNLPSVLEEKCGYRLFIHGRDDLPGEDKVELVEERMKQSKRLMVILTLGSRSGSDLTDHHPASLQTSEVRGYDWQMGLHHVLVQREMSVILIQIGETGSEGYTHLPPSLQHLIRQSAPIQWRGATSSNSRFWKRVRYLMPPIPAGKCAQSVVI